MEQFKALLNTQKSSYWICILLCVALSSCKKPVENPETLDPIYSDLMNQSAGLKTKAEGQKKKIEDLAAKLGKYGPRDPELKRTEHEKENLERGLEQIEQDALYFEIRANQRRIYDKEAYAKAFKADEAWPSPDDAHDYETSKKLRNASRDWDKNVPVDKSHNKPVEDKKKKTEAKKAE